MSCYAAFEPFFRLTRFLFASSDHPEIVEAAEIIRGYCKLGQKLLAGLRVARRALQEIRQAERGPQAGFLRLQLNGFRKMRSGLLKIAGLAVSKSNQGMRARVGLGRSQHLIKHDARWSSLLKFHVRQGHPVGRVDLGVEPDRGFQAFSGRLVLPAHEVNLARDV